MAQRAMCELYITARHPLGARTISAIRVLREATGMGLAQAKQIYTRARAGEWQLVELPTDEATSVARQLSELGWEVSLEGTVSPAEPPAWAQRLKGEVEVEAHTSGDSPSSVGLRLLEGEVRVEAGDELAVYIPDILVGAAIHSVLQREDGNEVILVVDTPEEARLLRCFFEPGTILMVLRPPTPPSEEQPARRSTGP